MLFWIYSSLLKVLSLSWLKGWKSVYLPPNRTAECKVILHAATPVGAVSNTNTSSGSITPDSLSRNLSVSEWIKLMTWDLPIPPGPQGIHDMAQLVSLLSTFLHQLRWNMTIPHLALGVVAYILALPIYWSGGISCLLVALSNRTCKLAVVVDIIRLALSLKSSWDTSVSNSLPFLL